jgi:hypothetical protein
MGDTVKLVGSGGVEIEFDLPLPQVYVDQVNKGELRPLGPDDAKALGDVLAEEPAASPESEVAPEPEAVDESSPAEGDEPVAEEPAPEPKAPKAPRGKGA